MMTNAAPVNTKAAPHRDLHFDSFEDILTDLETIENAVNAGTATTTGNWTIGENCDHCAKFLACACDGFGKLAPAPLRFVFRALFFKKAMGDDPIPAGFKLPKQASILLPTPGITDAEGIGELRKQLKRVIAGKEMTARSPVFGTVTHDQWHIIQRKHCALHLGFIQPG